MRQIRRPSRWAGSAYGFRAPDWERKVPARGGGVWRRMLLQVPLALWLDAVPADCPALGNQLVLLFALLLVVFLPHLPAHCMD